MTITNKQKRIIKRTFIVLLSIIGLLIIPYFIGEFTIPTHLPDTHRPEPSIAYKWIIGLIFGVIYGTALTVLGVILFAIYQWIISEE